MELGTKTRSLVGECPLDNDLIDGGDDEI